MGSALFRCCPEDFIVDEIIDIQPTGEGEHLLLLVSKRDQNTTWVAGLLAKLAGIPRNDVGFCGMKDRFAVTSQWFSLHVPGRDLDLNCLEHDDFTILQVARHNKKLRRGMHKGNQFRIVLQDFSVTDVVLKHRIDLIVAKGVPNYFGEQRFGHNGNNLDEVQKLIQLDKLKGNRHGTGLYLSAARSWLFNLVTARRLQEPHGDLAECTGPLWGRGRPISDGQVATIASDVLDGWQDWCYALEHAGLKQQRRDLIMEVGNLTAQWVETHKLCLEFSLPSGCYATTLMREIAELSRPDNFGL